MALFVVGRPPHERDGGGIRVKFGDGPRQAGKPLCRVVLNACAKGPCFADEAVNRWGHQPWTPPPVCAVDPASAAVPPSCILPFFGLAVWASARGVHV